MGFFKKDLGYASPLDLIMEGRLNVKLNGAKVEVEEEGAFVVIELPREDKDGRVINPDNITTE